jgi:hypothetical protein
VMNFFAVLLCPPIPSRYRSISRAVSAKAYEGSFDERGNKVR